MTRATPLVVVIAVVLVAGCAKYDYGKPAGTYADFRDDSIACARNVGIPSGSGQYAAVSPDLYRRCMVAKGWARSASSLTGTAGSVALRTISRST